MLKRNSEKRKKTGGEMQPAIILTPLAWIVFLGGQSLAHGAISVVHLALGGLCCMLVARGSRWGRLFCAPYNVLLVISIYSHGSAEMVWPAMDIVSGLCFSVATIALFLPVNPRSTADKYPMTAL